MQLNKNIYILRKAKGYSQELLAEKVKVSRQTISNWELGETNPNPKQLVLLSKALNVSIDELVGNNFNNNNKLDSTSKKNIAFSILILILVIAIIVLLILLFKERDKNTIKLHLTTKPTTTTATSKANIDDVFIRTYKILSIEKVDCYGITGCDDTTFKVTLNQCNKEAKEIEISNSQEFKKLEKGKTYEFKFQPLVGEVYYEDKIVNIFAFNSVIEVKEINKKCDNQIQDAIKSRSQY